MSGFRSQSVVQRAVAHSQARRQAQLDAHALEVGPVIEGLRRQRHSWRAIAGLLGGMGHHLLRGGTTWDQRQARRVHARWVRIRHEYLF